MLTLCFYLVATTTGMPATASFVGLPANVAFNGATRALIAVVASAADHITIKAAKPQPSGWTGTVGDARAVLRANDLVGSWWLFDWFATSHGIATNEHVSVV